MLRNLRRGVKKCLYFVIFYSGLLKAAVLLLKRLKKNHSALILFYHRFYEEDDLERILPHLDVQEFEKQLFHLKSLYTIISMEKVAEILRNHESFTGPSIVLTIDDGYADNYTLVYPVLQKLGIPATLYITSGLVNSSHGLWVDEIEYLLLHTRMHSSKFPELFGDAIFDVSTFEGKKVLFKSLFLALLKKNNSQRQAAIQKLSDILDVDISDMNNKQRVMLNWEEIREMSDNRVSFGAHTLTHAYLPAMEFEKAKEEISESKKLIESRIRKPVRHFAIPNGKSDDFTEDLRRCCKEIGFDTIVTTEPGSVSMSANPFSLNRVLPPPPLYYFACEIARYMFFKRRYHKFKK